MYSIFHHDSLRVAALAGLFLMPGLAGAHTYAVADSVQAVRNAENLRYVVSGQVTDAATRKGFAGAQVTVPNLNVSAMTDDNGHFEIRLPNDGLTLMVSAPGYARRQIAVRGRKSLKVVLHPATDRDETAPALGSSNGETVVAGFSASAQSMTDDLTTLTNGQVRAVSRSGEPGASSNYFIRGYNTLNLSSQPLFVVDGVIWQMQDDAGCLVDNYNNNPLTLLDPSDIEKVTILKNGSAIWGAKGANGVVLIQTKRAHGMATRIDANISVGFQTPFKSMPMMDASAYRRYASDVMQGMDRKEADGFQFTNDDPTRSFYRENHNNTDWLDEINKTSLLQQYGISVSGGDNVALYRFSLGYAKNDGNIDNTSFNRLNMRFNSDIRLTEQFQIASDISYAQSGRKVAFDGLDRMRSPYFAALSKSPLYSPYQYNENGTLSGRVNDVDELNHSNPLALVNEDYLPNMDKYRFNLNLHPVYHFGPRVELSALFGVSYDKENERSFIPNKGVSDQGLTNAQGEVYATANNEVRNLMARQTSISIDGYLGWQILKNWRHDLNARIGARYYNTYYKYTYGQGYNTGTDEMTGLENTNSNLRYLSGNEFTDRNVAWYLNADYNLLNRYFLNFAVSAETSSRFGKDAGGLGMCGVSWGCFPSVQGAWLISSEKFMRNVTFIDNLKLRLAYTMAGNDNLPIFANRTYFTSGSFARDANGLVLSNLGNERLKWETVGRTNIGLDFSLFNDRLWVNADWYWSKTKDMVAPRQLSEVAGLSYYWDNVGEMENKGFEIGVRGRALSTPDFRLELGATIGHYRNEVTQLNDGRYITDLCGGQVLTEVGRPVGVFYGYRTNGVYTNAAEAAQEGLSIRSASGQLIPFTAGDMRFVDAHADGVIDEKDRVVIGNPNPDIYGNFDLTFSWKRLTLGAIFTYSVGNDAYNALRAQLESGSTLMNQTTAMENRWMADGQHTDIPKATYGDPMGNARFSDRWIEDASYLKFKRLTLSYDIPFKTTFLQNIKVWVAANNLCTLTKYTGIDPEFSYSSSVLSQGIDAGYTPQSRSFQLGVNISL